jgi:hypothetical protein
MVPGFGMVLRLLSQLFQLALVLFPTLLPLSPFGLPLGFLPFPLLSLYLGCHLSLPPIHWLLLILFILLLSLGERIFYFFLFDPGIVSEILKITIRSNSDLLLWTPSSTGAFSTKSAHHHICSSLPPPPSPLSPSSWKSLWKLNLNHRLKLFLWKMVWNIIPTKARISQSIPSSLPDTSCSLCSFPLDSLLHLFFTCPIARVVWRHSFWPLDINALNVTNITDWLLISLDPHRMIGIPLAEIHLFQIFAAVDCDYLWFIKNKVHHDGLIPNALAISSTINKTVLEHHSAWKTKLAPTPEVWQAPSPPYLKINYDTAIRDSFSTQSAICRDFSGSIIRCISLISPPCTAIYGEALAALLATRLAISMGIPSFILEGDSLLVTPALQRPDITQDWRIASIISTIHSIISPTSSWKASKVNRSANFCAHYVANWAATRNHSGCIPTFSPLSGSIFPFSGTLPPCFGRDSSSFFVP